MMKKIIFTALTVSCSLALSSCSNDPWSHKVLEVHGYPKVHDWYVDAPVAPPPPPPVVVEREMAAPVPLPPPAPKKKKKPRKLDVREAS